MENKNLTAVEWVADKLNKEEIIIYHGLFDMWIEQAKQMEKEQIINAWRNGENDSMYEPKQLDEQAEQYYNETYNKQA